MDVTSWNSLYFFYNFNCVVFEKEMKGELTETIEPHIEKKVQVGKDQEQVQVGKDQDILRKPEFLPMRKQRRNSASQ